MAGNEYLMRVKYIGEYPVVCMEREWTPGMVADVEDAREILKNPLFVPAEDEGRERRKRVAEVAE